MHTNERNLSFNLVAHIWILFEILTGIPHVGISIEEEIHQICSGHIFVFFWSDLE